jgi:SAM-dependent methyltransferase
MSNGAASRWNQYLESFHRERPGITEDLLGGARDRTGATAYEWLLAAHPGGAGLTIDVGCGSAPSMIDPGRWVGLDRCLAELRAATRNGRTRGVQGAAHRLPFADDVAEVAVYSMSLMVVDEPATSLVEAARVLRPGGSLMLLLPARAPMTLLDRWRMGSVMAVVAPLGFPFPNRDALRHATELARDAGFRITSDERRRFAINVDDGAGGRFIDALYLPGVRQWRVLLAKRLARRWRGELGIPLRRVVAVSADDTGPPVDPVRVGRH